MSALSSRPFVFFRDDFSGRELFFQAPSEIITADTPETFAGAFDRAEVARRAGKWLAGYFSYEAGYLFEPKLAPLLPPARRAPLICLGVFDAPSDERFCDVHAGGSAGAISDPRPAWSFDDYKARFDKVHEHLRRGDFYQANLTFPVDARWRGDPAAIFAALAERQPVRHAALVALEGPAESPLEGPVLLSRSPELFFEVDAERWIETRPMKGTAPRGRTPAEDERNREFLRSDPKNQAENRMIVDLLRNDISLISETGTLDVPELFRIESFATVHQMVSRVRSRLLPGLTIAEIFAALFPCGSITGAPKIRAMEVLRELEARPRNAYCGAIGWIEPNGRMRFNVAIRTISLYRDHEAVFNVGGGVVFDSTAEDEYAECLLKARYATPVAST